MAITSSRAISLPAIIAGLGGGNAVGTNAVAVGATLTNSLSTGNATNPNFVIQVGVKTTSGAAQATSTTALTLVGETLAANFAGAVTSPSLALGGAAIGTNALAVTGTTQLSSALGINVAASVGIQLRITGTGAADGTRGIYVSDSGGLVNFFVNDSGNVAIGRSAVATNATNGFAYIAANAGTPTGTPTAQTGYVPMYIDTTNSQLWLYMGGAWRQPKTPAGAALITWQ